MVAHRNDTALLRAEVYALRRIVIEFLRNFPNIHQYMRSVVANGVVTPTVQLQEFEIQDQLVRERVAAILLESQISSANEPQERP
jgi:hypothetical protein